jgi:hypothetical protein
MVGIPCCSAMLVLGQAKESEFKSLAGRNAETKFLAAQAEIERDYRQKMTAAREKYVAALTKARDEATRVANLDEAIRIRDAIDRVRKSDPLHAPSAREGHATQLAGTTWSASNGNKRGLAPDGTLLDGKGRVCGHWYPLDDRQVLLRYDGNNWADLWQFDPTRTSYKCVAATLVPQYEGHKIN